MFLARELNNSYNILLSDCDISCQNLSKEGYALLRKHTIRVYCNIKGPGHSGHTQVRDTVEVPGKLNFVKNIVCFRILWKLL